jgi:hypothetical protein
VLRERGEQQSAADPEGTHSASLAAARSMRAGPPRLAPDAFSFNGV